jgi:hypothetical protein
VAVRRKRTYNVVFLEVRADIAVTSKVSGRGTPASWVRGAISNVRGNVVGNPPEDLDVVIGPFHGVDTATVAVEVSAPTFLVLGDNGAALVAVNIGITVVVVEGTGEAGVIDGAVGAGVQGHLIGSLQVGTLDDVDFTIIRPVGSVGPATWLVSATGRQTADQAYKAGQEPQAETGMWARSRMNKPVV